MELVIQLYLYNAELETEPFRKQAKQIRQMEINECFLQNLHHPLINTIHILCDTNTTKEYYEALAKQYEKHMKCFFVEYGKQPTYADMLRYVSKNIPDNQIVCIQNSDIYISPSVSYNFLSTSLTYNTLISLTRHEYTDNEHSLCNISTCPLIWDYQGSHDTFLFRTPVPSNFPYDSVEIPQNVYGAEAVFMKAWQETGKKLFNPCFDISIFHRHMNRVSFHQYPTVADGYLSHVNPSPPENRPDISKFLQTIFKD